MRSLHRLAVGLSVTEPLCHRALNLNEGEEANSLDGDILKKIFRYFGGLTHSRDT
jgi:hypothetical protein